ncbi:MAG: amidohydrolase family protein, partial [Gemmatimonadota bacterium]
VLMLGLAAAFGPGTWLVGPRPALAQQETVVLTGGWLFDGTGDEVVRNPGIVVRAGKIMEVGADPERPDLAGARVVRLEPQQYVLPGIFDLHAHYNVRVMGGPRLEEFDVMPVLYLANGATSTFPAGEYDPEGMHALRERIEAGDQIGPRLLSSGPYFGSARPDWDESYTRDDIHRQVDEWVDRGVAGFKAKGIAPEHLRALIERAHFHGLTVTGHLGSGYRNSVNPRDAILMGIDRIEHFLGGDAFPADRSAYASFPEFRPDTREFRHIVELYERHDVVYDATLTAYGYFAQPDEVFEQWVDESSFFVSDVRRWIEENDPQQYSERFDAIYRAKCALVRAFHEAGGTLTVGTDHVSNGRYLPAFGVHREMHAFVRCGIPPAAAIRAATINGARALNRGDKFGTIEAGKFADLLVVDGNPLDDIRNTRNVRLVMKAGELYDARELLRSVEGRLDPPRADRTAEEGAGGGG